MITGLYATDEKVGECRLCKGQVEFMYPDGNIAFDPSLGGSLVGRLCVPCYRKWAAKKDQEKANERH